MALIPQGDITVATMFLITILGHLTVHLRCTSEIRSPMIAIDNPGAIGRWHSSTLVHWTARQTRDGKRFEKRLVASAFGNDVRSSSIGEGLGLY